LGALRCGDLKVILDTNVVLSALIAPASLPGRLLVAWRQGKFALLTCEELLVELRRSTRYARIKSRTKPHVAGRLVNEIGANGILVADLPFVNYLLSLAEVGQADFIVTGDKPGLLSLERHRSTRIVSVREFADELGLE
jgi:uncharacterized protein